MMFSIIVPVYNVETYIKTCMNSVLRQSFSDYELILIDDGSSDNSGEICDMHAGKYNCIHVIHQENKGQAHARNQAILAAEGDYILFLDGDDYFCNKRALFELAQYITGSKESPDILAYKGISVYSDGKKMRYSKNGMNKLKETGRVYTGEEFLKVHLAENPMYKWYPWLYVYSRKIFENNRLYFPCHRKYEDVYLVWRLLMKAQRVVIVPDIIYAYRSRRKGSTTEKASYEHLKDFLWVIEQNICDVKQSVRDPLLQSYLLNNFVRNYCLCCTSAYTLDKEEKTEMFDLLEKDRRFMNYASGRMYMLAGYGMKILGLKNMVFLLYLYSRLNNARKRLRQKILHKDSDVKSPDLKI